MGMIVEKLISGKLCVFLMFMYSWDTIIWCLNSLWCSNLLPPRQQGAFFFCVERTKRLWHGCLSSSNPSNRTWPRWESINLNYLPSGKKFGCHTSLLCRKVGRAKRSGKFWCETRIMCIGKNIFPNHGVVWKAIEQPKRSFTWSWTFYKLGMISSWEDLPFRLTSWALNDSSSFCRVWTWMAWAWSISLLSALCSFFLAFLLELPLVGKA
jgi:hypothetical protein